MAQLKVSTVLSIAVISGLGGFIWVDRYVNASEPTPLCQGAQVTLGFDEVLVYIQSAQGYMTGRVDSEDLGQCPESAIGRFLLAKDDPVALDKLYDERLEQRDERPSVESRYAWDVETLLQINLECNADWDCAQKRISALISMGLIPSQSLVFCGFDDSLSPNAVEIEGLTKFRRPQSLPFICDELIGGSGISEGWIRAYTDYFDGR